MMGVDMTDSKSSAKAPPSRMDRGVAGRNIWTMCGREPLHRMTDSQRRQDAKKKLVGSALNDDGLPEGVIAHRLFIGRKGFGDLVTFES